MMFSLRYAHLLLMAILVWGMAFFATWQIYRRHAPFPRQGSPTLDC